MTEEEKEILEATKEFAEIHDIPYDDRIELMILNAMREVVKNCSIPVVVGRSEQLLAFKTWERDKCKLPWDASPEQIIEQYLSQ